MAFEIERKFLVLPGEAFKGEAREATRITQGYLCSAPGRTVRVRIRGERGYLTIKGMSRDGGLSRYEWEKEIPLAEARELMELCEPGVIDKTRYLIDAGDGLTWEVDEFYGDNQGLVMAEIELPAADAPFARPAWLGREVTSDRRYYNSSLTKLPFTQWTDN
jgi:adenylate cyclase